MSTSPPDSGGDLRSSPPPPPAGDDHIRGDGPLVIEYADLECPYCAQTNLLLEEAGVRRVFRHFPVTSKHPRARILARAAEAAAAQGEFWPMHDSLLADQGRLDDPHLWERCRALGIDLERFELDRRADPADARVTRDFQSGVRAGVTTTPTLFAAGRAWAGVPGTDFFDQLKD